MTEEQKERLARQIPLIGEEGCDRLAKASVLIAGVGGVGGYAAEALARMGVGHITLVDRDVVSVSNLNRQIVATLPDMGRHKTEVMRERMLSISPSIRVESLPIFITRDNAAAILEDSGADAVVDAIDNMTAKLALVCAAKEQGRYICSSMGTGNKLDGQSLRIADVYETSGCPLARIMRKELRARGVKGLDVVFSDELRSIGAVRLPATMVYVPAIAGMLLAECVFKHLLDIPRK